MHTNACQVAIVFLATPAIRSSTVFWRTYNFESNDVVEPFAGAHLLREIRARLCRVSPREEALPRTCRQIPTSWKLFLCKTPLHFVVQRFLVLHTILNRMTSSNMAHEYSMGAKRGRKESLGRQSFSSSSLARLHLAPKHIPEHRCIC